MDYLHPPFMQQDEDSLFNTYLHPPMLLPDDGSNAPMGSLQPHPPMLPQEWSNHHSDYYHNNNNDNAMRAY